MRLFDSLSLSKKLHIGFGTVVLLLLGLAAFAVTQVLAIGSALSHQQQVQEEKLMPLYIAREALDQTGIAARNSFIMTDEKSARQELDIIDAQKAIYLEQLKKLGKVFAADELFVKINADMIAMGRELDRPRIYRSSGEMEEFGRFLIEECSPLRRRIVSSIALLLEKVEQQNNEASAVAQHQKSSAIMLIVVATLATVTTAAFVAFAITRALLSSSVATLLRL